MKKLALLALLFGANTFAVSYISLPRGGSTTVYPGPDQVVVSCLASPATGPCEIRMDSSNFKLFYIAQNGIRISRDYLEEGARRVIADFRALGICP